MNEDAAHPEFRLRDRLIADLRGVAPAAPAVADWLLSLGWTHPDHAAPAAPTDEQVKIAGERAAQQYAATLDALADRSPQHE